MHKYGNNIRTWFLGRRFGASWYKIWCVPHGLSEVFGGHDVPCLHRARRFGWAFGSCPLVLFEEAEEAADFEGYPTCYSPGRDGTTCQGKHWHVKKTISELCVLNLQNLFSIPRSIRGVSPEITCDMKSPVVMKGTHLEIQNTVALMVQLGVWNHLGASFAKKPLPLNRGDVNLRDALDPSTSSRTVKLTKRHVLLLGQQHTCTDMIIKVKNIITCHMRSSTSC